MEKSLNFIAQFLCEPCQSKLLPKPEGILVDLNSLSYTSFTPNNKHYIKLIRCKCVDAVSHANIVAIKQFVYTDLNRVRTSQGKFGKSPDFTNSFIRP